MFRELSNSLGAIGATSGEDVKAFVEQLAREFFLDGVDRRIEPRLRVTLPVRIVPVSEDRTPQSYCLRGVTRDISESGIGLVCQDPITEPLISIQLSTPRSQEIEVFAEVIRCRPVGYYFDIGGLFVFGK
jgi:hypothetical protein